MKTNLPAAITSVEEAKAFLTELQANGESYHPEDDAHDIAWAYSKPVDQPNPAECDQLNKLMHDIYVLNGNDHTCPVFDPCEFLLELDPDYAGAMANIEPVEENPAARSFYRTSPNDMASQMTKREHFAAMFTQGFMASGDGWDIAITGGIKAADIFIERLNSQPCPK